VRSKILVIHGPNLDSLGKREKGHYGSFTLNQINCSIQDHAEKLGFEVEARQSDMEGEIVKWISKAEETFNGLMLNPAGFGYTSVALRDAILLLKIPVIEVHLSNIHAREKFRHHTLTSEVCAGQISGFREWSYLLGLDALHYLLL
jgi:3-dehydroquinate dehydratase II